MPGGHAMQAERVGAMLIAAMAWAGLVVQTWALCGASVSLGQALWIMAGFFTITTNLLVAVVFTAIAAGWRGPGAGWVVAGTMLSIVLVGVIYELLLRGLMELSGGSAVANGLLHVATPVAVPLFWVVWVRKGQLHWRHPLLWSIYPLAYLGYALVRGGIQGRYAYPFVDVGALGWGRVGVNAVGIAAAFLLAAYGLVWVDGRVGSGRAAVTS